MIPRLIQVVALYAVSRVTQQALGCGQMTYAQFRVGVDMPRTRGTALYMAVFIMARYVFAA